MKRALRMSLVLLGVASGCGDNEIGIDKRRPNRAPETILASGPPDGTYSTLYKVPLFWSGSDADGTIDHFDYILVDHPAAHDSIHPEARNRVVVRPPEADDPRWISTYARDTLIVTRADTLRTNPAPPPGLPPGQLDLHNALVRRQSFERWHTFFVRAVDNEGLADPTPEYRSFNSKTLAPEVFLKPPVNPGSQEFSGPKVIVFNWDGSDPVGDGTSIAPIASRWVLLPSRRNYLLQYDGYPDSLYLLKSNRWSEWRRWDALDKSGVRAIVRGLVPNTAGPGRGFYLFAVQAMDEAGAVTPIFDAHAPNRNNVAKVFVNDLVGASLVVQERFLGVYNFVGGSRPVILDVAAGQAVRFRWRGDASSYGGEIAAYRYGWNIRNPSNDEEWEQNWSETAIDAPARVFNSGAHRFFVETRDNAETITHAEFELVVRQVTKRRDLLIVDDTAQPQQGDEAIEDRRWRLVVDSLLARRAFAFEPGRDIFDVSENQSQPPQLSTVFDYRTVVWLVVQPSRPSALRTLAYFFDPFVERNRNAVVKFNYLNIYLDNGGEMWLSGDQPTHAVWPIVDNKPNLDHQLPANLTNWDDPVQPHPEEDSVGVNSFIYRIGVEAVDLGGGIRAPRPRRDRIRHQCVGFRRSTPPGYELQGFQSSTAVEHEHQLIVRSEDVEAAPAAGVTYSTREELEHRHEVTITRAELRTLQRGGRVTVTTTESALPQPHRHTVVLVDQQGLWGAPRTLVTDASWAQPSDPLLNPERGRPNIEIYNMPTYMGRQTPPLSPEPGIWVSLYDYVSGEPAEPSTGTIYPATADGQPAIILRKAAATDAYYSRALCGFQVFQLSFSSHLALADYILLRHFRLGLSDAP